jgi:hypothetical protein
MTISEMLSILRKLKGRYNWALERGGIVCRLKGSRTRGIEPIVALARVIFNRPRLLRMSNRWARLAPFDHENFWAFVWACRPRRRLGMSPRERWIRKLVMKVVELSPCDE